VAVIKPDADDRPSSSTLLPDPNAMIEEGDVLLVDGPDEAIEEMARSAAD
jgi:uncharacterized protein with PhoU and TrkA domain